MGATKHGVEVVLIFCFWVAGGAGGVRFRREMGGGGAEGKMRTGGVTVVEGEEVEEGGDAGCMRQ